jgi:hypothetical protein
MESPRGPHDIKSKQRPSHNTSYKKVCFGKSEKTLLISYFYLVLYYDSEIWLSALRTCPNSNDLSISHVKICRQFKQLNPKTNWSLQIHTSIAKNFQFFKPPQHRLAKVCKSNCINWQTK